MAENCDIPSTKDSNHQRRNEGGPAVMFEGDMVATLKKDIFLSNNANMLSSKLQQAGYAVRQALGDADVLIVSTAIEKAKTETTVLIGDDTDLLILLIEHTEMDAKDLYFRPEPRPSLAMAVKGIAARRLGIESYARETHCYPHRPPPSTPVIVRGHSLQLCNGLQLSKMLLQEKWARVRPVDRGKLSKC
ncbi:predicted protein [Nematostella vectensis]|uniref:Uncharacterized protein n=1 Tax=Nematostella vectensis TaxID=45351 RepID=A7ST67_NEMVE|nr:predicted protein [Nematostella vectensis]|eukprot:XP_001625197.1 predicted protein [Nematostella vectensis]